MGEQKQKQWRVSEKAKVNELSWQKKKKKKKKAPQKCFLHMQKILLKAVFA